MSIEFFTKYGIPIIGLLTPVIAVVVFYRTYLREHVRQLEILDKASKRLAFWDQLLKMELCTASPDAAAQDKFKQKAFQASQKIHADANEAMAILVWKQKLNRKFGFKAFQPEWRKLPGFWKKIEWFLYALIAAGFLALAIYLSALLMWVVIQGTTPTVTTLTVGEIFLLGSFVFSRFFLSQAENLKHPRSPGYPVIDKV